MSIQEFNDMLAMRQPALFMSDIGLNIKQILNLTTINNLYPTFDVRIAGAPIQLVDCIKLFGISSSNISENNELFLEETGLCNKMNDKQLRPNNLFSSSYDLVILPRNNSTLLKYNICYRTFIVPTEGSVKIKLCPPKNIKYINFNDSVDVMNTSTEIDCWNNDEITKLIPKVKFLEFSIDNGQMLYVPPYWCYSIKSDNTISSVFILKYSTYMNVLSNTHLYIQQFLQQQNIKKILPYEKITAPEEKHKTCKKMINSKNEIQYKKNNIKL
jgi:hypothetical protein